MTFRAKAIVASVALDHCWILSPVQGSKFTHGSSSAEPVPAGTKASMLESKSSSFYSGTEIERTDAFRIRDPKPELERKS